MANEIVSAVRRGAGWSIAISLLMIGAGILAIALPTVAGTTLTVLIGWLLMLSGVLHLLFAWRAGHASAIVWEVLLGLAYGLIGFYILGNPAVGLASLTLAVGIYLFIEAILECVMSFQLRQVPGSGWLLFDGIVTLVLALVIWSTWPSSSVWVIGTLLGLSMLFSGMTRLMLSLAVREAIA